MSNKENKIFRRCVELAMIQSNNLNDADYGQDDWAEHEWSNERKNGKIATFRRRTMLVTLEMMREFAFSHLKKYNFDLRERDS